MSSQPPRDTDGTSDRSGSSPLAPPEGRYTSAEGGSSGIAGKFIAIILAALAIALVVAGGITLYRYNTAPDISGKETGFTVIDSATVEARVDITRSNPETAVYCIVRAKEYSGAEVGRREVFVPAGGDKDKTVRLTTQLSTTGPAVMSDVYGCGSDVPEYLRR